MAWDNLVEIALVAVAWAIGWLQRNSRSKRRWRLIREEAKRELESPVEGTATDAETAVANATLSVDRRRIRTESRLLRAQQDTDRLRRAQSPGDPATKQRLPRAETNGDHT